MDVLDCKICHNPYDEENHRPRSAPCGHELCTSCIRGLIKDSTLLCPKCRRVSKVEVPDDLPITYGLIDVIRAYKTMNISSNKENTYFESGATNNELCSIHCKTISHWCLICQIWICIDCLESHSTLIGCSTQDMGSIKDKNIKDADSILATYEEDAKDVFAKVEEHAKLAEKHAEEANKFRKVLDKGNTHKEKLVQCKHNLNTANSPHAVIEGMKLLTQRKQLLRSWSAMNIKADTPLGLMKRAFANKKDVFTEKVSGSDKISAKLTIHGEKIYFHTFWKQAVADGSFCVPFEDLKKDIPSCPSLVFLELSVEAIKMGPVMIRLNKDLPNIREYMVKIVTGEDGHSLREVKFSHKRPDDIYASPLSFGAMRVTTDKLEARVPTAKYGDILGYFSSGSLTHIYCYISTTHNNNYGICYLLGTIEYGMDTFLECHNKVTNSAPMVISDCGLVIDKNSH